MKKLNLIILGLVALFASCDDTTDTLGSSLTNVEDVISVTDGSFHVSSKSVLVESVLARSNRGYLGNVKDPETGMYVKNDFMTQFHIFENYTFPEVDSLKNGIYADSCEVRLYCDKYYGDSLAIMKATLYEMSSPLKENVDYKSDLNPVAEGLVRTDNGIKVTRSYSLCDKNLTDSLRGSSSYVRNIRFPLNEPYTDVNGKTYNNYGTYLMQKYYDNPDNYRNTYNFLNNVCPGIYVKIENGIGSMADIYLSQLNIYFSFKNGKNVSGISTFVGTEEVLQTTFTSNDRSRLQNLVDDETCTYVKSPAGIFTELTLPVDEIFTSHETDSINSAKISIGCLNDTEEHVYKLDKPTTLLMVHADSIDTFFTERKIANYRTTYLANYSSSSNSYVFGNIGQLIQTIYNAMPHDNIQREAWKKEHPNWNKVMLIPVSTSYTTYGSNSILSGVSNAMSLSSVRLVGGSANKHTPLKLDVIYSKFK